MRTLCDPTKHKEAYKNLIYLENKLTAGEKRFHKQNEVRYLQLFKMARTIWNDVKLRHVKKVMLNELMFLELHSQQRTKVTKHFKLKDTRLHTLYRQYADINTVKEEAETFAIISDLIASVDKALRLEPWLEYLQINNKRFLR